MGDGMPGDDEDDGDPTLQNPPEGTGDGAPHNGAGDSGGDALGHESGGPTSDDGEIPNLWDANRSTVGHNNPDQLGHTPCPEDDFDDLRLEEEEALNGWRGDQHQFESRDASRQQDPKSSTSRGDETRTESESRAIERRHAFGQTSEDSDSEQEEPMETDRHLDNHSSPDSSHQQDGVSHPSTDVPPQQELHNSPGRTSHLVNGKDNHTEPLQGDTDGSPNPWAGEEVDVRKGRVSGRKRRLSSDEDSDDGALVIADSNEYDQHTSTVTDVP